MAFNFDFGGSAPVPCLMGKAFTPAQAGEIAEQLLGESPTRVVIVDHPPTKGLPALVRALLAEDVEVVIRDHHDVTDEEVARGGRAAETRAAADEIRSLLGERATISTRQAHPACSGLIELGEFASPGTVILADADLDGLTAAMKAVGMAYPELDSDAAILDGPRTGQTAEGGLSPLAVLLAKGLGTIPPYSPRRPEASENAKSKLFADFVAAASLAPSDPSFEGPRCPWCGSEDHGGRCCTEWQRDQDAREATARLMERVALYEAQIAEAERLAGTATEPTPGVWLVDTIGADRYDLGTLSRALEARPGCRVTVVRKDGGPIAAACGGVQYSLARTKAVEDAGIDLRTLLPEGTESSPASGVISNTPFLLHVSEERWTEILPALRAVLDE